jgi:hypothetical protein
MKVSVKTMDMDSRSPLKSVSCLQERFEITAYPGPGAAEENFAGETAFDLALRGYSTGKNGTSG